RQYDALVDLPECLDDVYASVRSNILIIDPIPDVKSAFATMSRDESHRNSNVHSAKSSSTVYVSKNNNDWSINRNNQNRKSNRGPNTGLVCKHCNMTGHSVDRCFELIGYPPGFKRNPTVNNPINPKASVNNVSTCNSGSSSSATHTHKFCSGSGASHHLTYTAIFLFNLIDVSHLNIIVSHPNGTIVKVNKVGSFKLAEKFIIHDVLVVPGYHVSLLSMHTLASANRVNVVFNENDCLIQDLVQKSLMRTGSMVGGLYYLEQGHPVDQVLSVLKNKIDLSDLTSGPFEVCHKAKQTRKPFPLSNHKTTDLGQIVHLDVSGPYRVKRSNEPYDEERDCTGKDDGTVPRSKGKPGSADKSVAVRGPLHLLHVANKTTALFKYETEAQDRGNRTSIEPTSYPIVVKGYGNHHASTSGKSVQDTNVLSNNENINILGNIIADDNLDQDVATSDDENYDYVGEDFIDAMNKEMEALNRNNSWEIFDLPKVRKPIGINQNKTDGKLMSKDDFPLAMHDPLHSDLKLDFIVLRYLKGALGKGVFFKKGDKFELSAYVDSD
ncbi:hypothetical protein Tco_0336761, partial [Tanacetum coccineum]